MIAGLVQLNAQEAEKVRVDLRLGYATATDLGNGLLISLEPKWTIMDDMVVGFRIESAGLFNTVEVSNTFFTAEVDQVTSYGSFLGTYDYYYAHKEGSPFAAFAGGGLGLYSISSVVEDFDNNDTDSSFDSSFGGMLRVGFDYFKFRASLEANIFSKATIRNTNNRVIGETTGSYIGLSFGFYFGGGKWKRSGISEG